MSFKIVENMKIGGERAVEKYSANPVKSINVSGREVAWYELAVTASTMDYAVKLVREGCASWTLVTAEKQSSGRGTHGREWISLQGKGLYLSLILPPSLVIGCLEDLSVRTAEALLRTLKNFVNLPFEIKHPNDVTIKGRKIAGILFESVTRGEEVRSLILGMGLNLFQSRKDFKRNGIPDATSLLIEAGYVPGVEHLLTSFLEQFIPLFENGEL